jgi:hypothetical protein
MQEAMVSFTQFSASVTQFVSFKNTLIDDF